MFGPPGVLPRVLAFTQFYPGFTQLTRVKLGKTVQRFYPPTLPASQAYYEQIFSICGELIASRCNQLIMTLYTKLFL